MFHGFRWKLGFQTFCLIFSDFAWKLRFQTCCVIFKGFAWKRRFQTLCLIFNNFAWKIKFQTCCVIFHGFGWKRRFQTFCLFLNDFACKLWFQTAFLIFSGFAWKLTFCLIFANSTGKLTVRRSFWCWGVSPENLDFARSVWFWAISPGQLYFRRSGRVQQRAGRTDLEAEACAGPNRVGPVLEMSSQTCLTYAPPLNTNGCEWQLADAAGLMILNAPSRLVPIHWFIKRSVDVWGRIAVWVLWLL